MVKIGRNMTKILLLTVLLIGFSQCRSVQYASPKEFPGPKISFGNGGGFAGTYKEYLLCENGQLFLRTSQKSSFGELESIDKTETNQCFANYDQLGLHSISVNDPGNLFYFVKYSNKDLNHESMWGGVHSQEPESLRIFYRNLMHLVKGKNPIK